ncbi:MAG: hypothetical protein PXX73_03895 [Sideroxydans sp.]|nr:hypothetical protein [Sideroxydans sp.]
MNITFVTFFVLALPLMLSIVIWHSMSILNRKHGSDIRVAWYLFSLSFVITFVVAFWARQNGAINPQGTFVGNVGRLLEELLHVMLDLNTDASILLSIVAIIVIPQLLNYILSGLSGCASNPILIKESFKFLIWGFVKSVMVCAGIIFAVAVFGAWHAWTGWRWSGVVALLYTSATLSMLGFAMLSWYRDIGTTAPNLQKLKSNFLVRWLSSIHRCFTKNNQPVP